MVCACFPLTPNVNWEIRNLVEPGILGWDLNPRCDSRVSPSSTGEEASQCPFPSFSASIRVSNLEVTEVRQGEPGTLDEVAGGEVVGRGLAFKQLVGRLALVDPGVCFLRLGG